MYGEAMRLARRRQDTGCLALADAIRCAQEAGAVAALYVG